MSGGHEKTALLNSDDSLQPGYGASPNHGIQDTSGESTSSLSYSGKTDRSVIQSVVHPPHERIWMVAMCSLTACLAAMVNGMVLGYSSPTLSELENVDNVNQRITSSTHKSLFGAFASIGAMFGGLVAWPVSEYFGRQAALMISGVPALIGWILMANAAWIEDSYYVFYGVLVTGRVISGFAAGMSIFCVSVYIAEIASAKMRGVFGNCNQFFITIGAFLVYLFGTKWGNFRVGFSYSALIAAGVVTLFEFLMLFTYETPRWLYSKGKDHIGKRVLTILRGPKHKHHIANEIERIQAALKTTIGVKQQLLEFKSRAILIPFVLVLMLMFFQQFSGINAVIFYSASIFNSTGYDEKHSNLISAFGVGGVQIVATFVSVILIDLLGRRILLTVSSIGMTLSSFMMGVFFYVFEQKCGGCLGQNDDLDCLGHRNASDHYYDSVCLSKNFGFVAIASIIVFIVSFSLGWGPIPWSSMSELLPNRVRSLAGSIATFTNWFFAVIITFAFEHYAEKVTKEGAWWSFSAVMLVSIFFVILFLPETKGHTLEEIQEHFERGEIFAISCGRRETQMRDRHRPTFSSRASITDMD